MSGTHHLYTSSGRPMPPPPKTTPRRTSSVCRTPTRRYNPAQRAPSAFSKASLNENRDRQLVPVRGRQQSPDSASRQPRLLLEDVDNVRRRQLDEGGRPSGPRRLSPSRNGRQEEWRGSTLAEERANSTHMRECRGSEPIHRSPGGVRAVSPREAELYAAHTLTSRLRSSLSRGYSPQRGHAEQAVVGTELAPPMPLLQGTHRTSKNRYRTTIERFIQRQPANSQEEMRTMLEEYRGRENELCGALSEAYSDSWEAAVKGNESPSQPQSLQNRSRIAYDDRQDIVATKAFSLPENGRKHIDPSNGVGSDDGALAERYRQDTSQAVLSPHAKSSKLQSNAQGINGPRPLSEHSTPFRSEGMNHAMSAEKERYDEVTSPLPRRGPGGAATAVSPLGKILDYEELAARPGGMLTPPLPADLAAR
ncbi:uncharacterized protein Tco025E_05800 [Trypanosoma conorhini]|uniref:Uncharacterized protein n=1 Tax=Trypanosoma conorhini TaxID=83891 RepID=A0A3R7RWQ4_9TRYP|nr:uncharacterized protein Tco025E_05800 [Trypanosoma conorhini]RNF14623.1 hypothetical protein Tco025E_05800 [Trypanosoma conorhini]